MVTRELFTNRAAFPADVLEKHAGTWPTAEDLPYLVLGQTSCLGCYDVTFFGAQQFAELHPNAKFRGALR
jgi:hypothetical protein